MCFTDLKVELESVGFPEPLAAELTDMLHVAWRPQVDDQRLDSRARQVSQVKGHQPNHRDETDSEPELGSVRHSGPHANYSY